MEEAGHGRARNAASGFGRGWIPAERDIGLPDESALFSLRRAAERDGRLDALTLHDPRNAFGDGPPPQAGLEDRAVRHDGWTPQRKVRFLNALATGGTVRAACASVGMSPQAAYVLRRRERGFAHAWDAALVLARDHGEAVLAERALHGVEEEVYFRGELVGLRRRFDSRLLLAHLARLDRAAEDPAAQRHAGRFDELLGAIADDAPLAEGLGHAGDPPGVVFPTAERDAFAQDAAEAAWEAVYEEGKRLRRTGEAQEVAETLAAEEARAAAEVAWDEERAAMLARLDACLAAQAGDAASDPAHEPALEDDSPAAVSLPPAEFKSLRHPGAAPRPLAGGAGRRAEERRNRVTWTLSPSSTSAIMRRANHTICVYGENRSAY
jgi:hypothetical protein